MRQGRMGAVSGNNDPSHVTEKGKSLSSTKYWWIPEIHVARIEYICDITVEHSSLIATIPMILTLISAEHKILCYHEWCHTHEIRVACRP